MEHISDLFAVLELATTKKLPTSSPDPSSDYAISESDVVGWLLHRCYFKIIYRFTTAEREWLEKPWQAMKNWSPSPIDIGGIKPSRIKVPDEWLPVLDIYLGSDLAIKLNDKHIPFDGSTIEAWVRCLAKALAFADSRCNGKQELTADDLDILKNLLDVLDVLLATKEVEFAFLHTSLSDIFSPRYAYSMLDCCVL